MNKAKYVVSAGDVFKSNTGCQVVVLNCDVNKKVLVEYLEYGNTRQVIQFGNLRDGRFKNPCKPSVYGVGFMGVGKHKSSYNKVKNRARVVWDSMMMRCYDPRYQEYMPAYTGCTVHPDWHNFQNFAEWFENQVGFDLKWQLDKDILNKGNNVYSKDTCCLVPNEVNTLLINCKAVRGHLPVGVQSTKSGKFIAMINRPRFGSTYLGIFTTAIEAFNAYKEAKENYIKFLVEGFYSYLPENIKQSLLNYRVEITD